MKETIFPLSAFKDNYIWTIFDKSRKTAWIVDPGDAISVIHHFEQKKIRLAGILLTHHHWDHSGGVAGILKHFGRIPVVGGHHSKVDVSHKVEENDEITCSGIDLKILEIPGHTLDHIAYYNDNILFCGDTLFSGGCGKIFEGTPAQMYDSLQKIVNLPEKTLIYCGHEYTLSNLLFAERVEPENKAIKDKINQVNKKTANHEPTLPSTIKEEKMFNPFLRCSEPDVIESVEKHTKKKLSSSIEVFAHLRDWKNHFVR